MSKRYKRIVFLIDGFRMGGAEINLLALLRNLEKAPLQMALINIGPGGALADDFNALNMPVYHWQRAWMFDIKPYLKLYQFLRKNKIDIIQSLLPNSDIRGILIAKLAGVPRKISWETVSHMNDHFHGRFDQKYGYRWAMKYISRIVAVSNEVRQSIIERRHVNPDKIMTLHNAVNLNRFYVYSSKDKKKLREALNIAMDTFVLGVVARLDVPKAHYILIEALKQVILKYPVLLLIIGEGDTLPDMQEQVKILELEGAVRFMGKRTDIPELLNCMDVFCLSSIFEGLPNVILEAMACGLPVIASNIGGIPEAIRHEENGLLVPVKRSDLFAEAIIRIINDQSLKKKLSEKAIQRVKTDFSHENQLNQFKSLYESII